MGTLFVISKHETSVLSSVAYQARTALKTNISFLYRCLPVALTESLILGKRNSKETCLEETTGYLGAKHYSFSGLMLSIKPKELTSLGTPANFS